MIVSYRGFDEVDFNNFTDSFRDSLDVINGSGVAFTNNPDQLQSRMAFGFYNAIDAGTTEAITLTGHSMGSGLVRKDFTSFDQGNYVI